ncbi:MAG: ribonuclease III [Clostridia bacterium]|nr:ribonuclease III [Clostridia bacterium]
MTEAMKALCAALGYTFQREALLRQALTHPSIAGKDNQRLEFLGDAVLQYLMSDMLYAAYPGEQEGRLTRMRALLVCEDTQSKIAAKLGVGEALLMDHGEELTGGRHKPSVLCDALEALLAAVYLDGGMQAARNIVSRFWPEPETLHAPALDTKGALQQAVQAAGKPSPTYVTLLEEGPPHDRTYTAAVLVEGEELARGIGKSKKQAEIAAAKAALELIQPAEVK